MKTLTFQKSIILGVLAINAVARANALDLAPQLSAPSLTPTLVVPMNAPNISKPAEVLALPIQALVDHSSFSCIDPELDKIGPFNPYPGPVHPKPIRDIIRKGVVSSFASTLDLTVPASSQLAVSGDDDGCIKQHLKPIRSNSTRPSSMA
jgi:hypothetical protein